MNLYVIYLDIYHQHHYIQHYLPYLNTVEEPTMQIAKLFNNGRSQAVRLPAAFRFDGDSVYISRNENGDVVLSQRPKDWQGFIVAANELNGEIIERDTTEHDRNPFQDWQE